MTTSPPEKYPDEIQAWYRGLLGDPGFQADPAQQKAVDLLQEFADEIAQEKNSKSPQNSGGLISRLLKKNRIDSPPARAGIYLHGGVGRGKSFLMDGFFLRAPSEKKARVHFHAFMRRLHEDMKRRENESDSLSAVAAAVAEKFSLICFDEFHISDIADAMILARLLDILLHSGVRFVMTSNYPPDGLYPNGLARDRFLPAIALLKKRLTVHQLDGGSDHRLRRLSAGRAYYHPLNGETTAALNRVFDGLANGMRLPLRIKINGREVEAVARTSDAIWFDFNSLCGDARGQGDYLLLAERFAAIFLSEIPRLNDPSLAEASRRFTWLIDILYDCRVKLICAAAAPLAELYSPGEGGESGRTVSRLIEMQSEEYLHAVNFSMGGAS